MQKWREWQTASDSDWNLALEQEAVIRFLAEQTRLTRASVDQAAQQLRLSRGTLYRLLHRYRQRPQTSSLLAWKRGRVSSSHRLCATAPNDAGPTLRIEAQKFLYTI